MVHSVRLQRDEPPHSPRLFESSNQTGRFQMTEVDDFAQSDLDEEDVMLLDTWEEVRGQRARSATPRTLAGCVYLFSNKLIMSHSCSKFPQIFLWIGNLSNQFETKEAWNSAQEYLRTHPAGRDPDTPIICVKQGYEPPTFTGWFNAWDPHKWSVSLGVMFNSARSLHWISSFVVIYYCPSPCNPPSHHVYHCKSRVNHMSNVVMIWEIVNNEMLHDHVCCHFGLCMLTNFQIWLTTGRKLLWGDEKKAGRSSVSVTDHFSKWLTTTNSTRNWLKVLMWPM